MDRAVEFGGQTHLLWEFVPDVWCIFLGTENRPVPDDLRGLDGSERSRRIVQITFESQTLNVWLFTLIMKHIPPVISQNQNQARH